MKPSSFSPATSRLVWNNTVVLMPSPRNKVSSLTMNTSEWDYPTQLLSSRIDLHYICQNLIKHAVSGYPILKGCISTRILLSKSLIERLIEPCSIQSNSLKCGFVDPWRFEIYFSCLLITTRFEPKLEPREWNLLLTTGYRHLHLALCGWWASACNTHQP